MTTNSEFRITKYKLHQTINGGLYIDADSETGTYNDESVKKLIEVMLAGRFGLKFGKDRKVVSSSGFEQFSREVDAIPRDPKYAGMFDNVRDNFQQQFIDSMNDGEDILPEQPVSVGRSWRFEPRESLTNVGKYRYEGKTKFTGTEKSDGGDTIALLAHNVTGKQSAAKVTQLDQCKSYTNDGHSDMTIKIRYNVDKSYSAESKTDMRRTYTLRFRYDDPLIADATGSVTETNSSWVRIEPVEKENPEPRP